VKCFIFQFKENNIEFEFFIFFSKGISCMHLSWNTHLHIYYTVVSFTLFRNTYTH